MRLRSIAPRTLLAGGLMALLVSCSSYTTMAPETPPTRGTPANVVRRFEWSVSNSHPELLEDIFTSGFIFLSAAVDSAGNPSGSELPRDSVIAAFRAMLAGVPGRYAPARASLVLDRNLVPFPDPRPDADLSVDPVVYLAIQSRFHLRVDDVATGGAFEVDGAISFHLVRGDSADVPTGTPGPADSLQWWLDGVSEITGPASTNPTKLTLRKLLDLYLLRLGS